ncbi:hypothetical protein PT974_00461 [Cladobotryum mycophilum]|uniref:Uncharacterized protein n=1 Tax=Cladobotryum mycophilum TaxID=491253 RepID=A0ABR0T1H6_9HYPO
MLQSLRFRLPAMAMTMTMTMKEMTANNEPIANLATPRKFPPGPLHW